MIRTCMESDWLTVADLVLRGRPSLSPELIMSRLRAHSFVYEGDGQIQGVASRTTMRMSPTGTKISVWVYTGPEFRRRGLGNALWCEIWPGILGDEPQVLVTSYRSDIGDAPAFFARRGFMYLLMSCCLGYCGGRISYVPALTAEQYTEAHFWCFVNLANEAFLKLRRENNILPHLSYPLGFDEVAARERLALFGEGIYLFRNAAAELVGYVWIEGRAIDAIAVSPSHAGKGYGQVIMGFAMNSILEQGHDMVTLEVAEANTRARKLYTSLGFELMEVIQEAKMHNLGAEHR